MRLHLRLEPVLEERCTNVVLQSLGRQVWAGAAMVTRTAGFACAWEPEDHLRYDWSLPLPRPESVAGDTPCMGVP